MKIKNVFIIISPIFIITIVLYLVSLTTSIPFINGIRDVFIQTAMTTDSFQWIITSIYPDSIIDNAMKYVVHEEVDSPAINNIEPINKEDLHEPEIINNSIEDILNNNDVKIDMTKHNYETMENPQKNTTLFPEGKIIVDDIENGIKIIKFSENINTVYMAFIDNPSRISVKNSENLETGSYISEIAEKSNSIFAVNGGAILKTEYGSSLIGYSVSNGKVYGNGIFSSLTTIGINNKNQLVSGKINNHIEYEIRDAIQFGPTLVKNGEFLIEEENSYGVHPRTIIGQRADGTLIFMVVDGRQPGYSIGINLFDAAEIMYKYGAQTIAACDGGSSSVMFYNGEIINQPSGNKETGELIPNAFVFIN